MYAGIYCWESLERYWNGIVKNEQKVGWVDGRLDTRLLQDFFFGFRSQCSTCAFGWAKLGFMNFFFKFIDPWILHCHPSQVLHCNNNREIGPKIKFGPYFWLEGPIDTRSMRLNCILQDLFRDTPLDHIWCAQVRAHIQPNTVFGTWILCSFFAAWWDANNGDCDGCGNVVINDEAMMLLMMMWWSRRWWWRSTRRWRWTWWLVISKWWAVLSSR